MLELRETLKQVKRAVIKDYSSHCPYTNSSGGDYAFYKIYERIGEDLWEVSYDTSCNWFEYCPVQGYFQKCDDCYYWQYEEGEGWKCTLDYQKITTEELIKEIEEVLNDEFSEIKFDGVVIKSGNICGKCGGDSSHCLYDY